MAGHRMVHSFQPKQTYILNVQNNISRPQPTNVGGGVGWFFALPAVMMGLNSIFGMIGAFRGTSQQTPATLNPNQGVPQTTNNEADAKKKVALDDLAKIFGCTVISSEPGKYTVMYGKYPLAIDKDYYGARDAMLAIGDGKKPETTPETTPEVKPETKPEVKPEAKPDDGKGDLQKDKYDINKIQGNTTYTVQKGNTWYGIVSAKYDISGLSGKQILELAIQLAAANSGIENETDAMAAAHKGIYFKVGDVINLPKELTIGDTKVQLKEGETPDATDDGYDPTKGHGTTFAVTVQQVGDKWQLLKNGTVIKTFDTEAEAQAKKAELENSNS